MISTQNREGLDEELEVGMRPWIDWEMAGKEVVVSRTLDKKGFTVVGLNYDSVFLQYLHSNSHMSRF